MFNASTLPTASEIAEDAALARAEWEEIFEAAFDLLAGPNDCSDAFLTHVSEAYYQDGRTSEDWTDAEFAEAYRNLAISLGSDFMDADRSRLRAVCEERAEWARSAEVDPLTSIVATIASEADELAAAVYASAATYRVHGRAPHERFDPKTTPVMAEGLTFDQAGEVSTRLRAQFPALVFTVSAAGLAEQLAEAEQEIKSRRVSLSRQGRGARERLASSTGNPTNGPTFPALAREEAVEMDAADLSCHISACGSRFDLSAKMEQAEAFTLRRGGSSLAVPSKLRGTAALAERTARLAADVDAWDGGGSVYLPTVLHVVPEGVENGPGIAVLAAPNGTRAGAYIVGYLQDKHARWLAPLLNPTAAGTVTEDATPVRVYVTAVTGGTDDKPTRGVNVCITGAADAVRSMWAATARDEAEADAYESGDRTRIEATME